MTRTVRVSGYARIIRKLNGTVVVTTVKAYRREKPSAPPDGKGSRPIDAVQERGGRDDR